MDEREPVPTDPRHLHAIASEWQGRSCYRVGPEYDVELRGTGEDGYEGLILRRLLFDDIEGMIVLTLTAMDGEKLRVMIAAEDLAWVISNPVPDSDA